MDGLNIFYPWIIMNKTSKTSKFITKPTKTLGGYQGTAKLRDFRNLKLQHKYDYYEFRSHCEYFQLLQTN